MSFYRPDEEEEYVGFRVEATGFKVQGLGFKVIRSNCFDLRGGVVRSRISISSDARAPRQ